MKKFNQLFFCILFAFSIFVLENTSGQVFITSTPDTLATINTEYIYDVKATGIPDNPTYTLDKELDGMLINNITGVITWTPDQVTDGGKVIVRATNTGHTETQEFNIYVAGNPQCDPSTVGYWKLDEITAGADNDVFTDYSMNGHDGTEVGTVDDSVGVVEKAAGFRRISGNGITVPYHSDFHVAEGESFSVSLWFKIPTNVFPDGDPPVMFGRYEGSWPKKHWWIGFQDIPSYDIWFYVMTGPDPVTNFVNTNIKGWALETSTWYHLVCLYDADDNQMRMYLNGSNDDDFPGDSRTQYFEATNHFDSLSTPYSIGFLQGPNPMLGTLDEVLYFNKALSQSEIDALYNKGLAGNPACDAGNYGPLFITDPVTDAIEDQAYYYHFTANDIDVGDDLHYYVEEKPSWLTADTIARTLSGTPENDDVGSDSVVIKVTDGIIDTYQRFLLTVTNTNDAPVITSSEITTVNEEEAYSYDVEASDDDVGDHLAFSLQPPTPGWLSINASSGLITGTPAVDDTSSYTVTVRATDDSAAYDEQTFTLDILNINDAPQITGQLPLDVDEDNSLLIQLSDITYTDVDNGAGDMTLTVADGDNYSVVANSITPDLNYSGALVVNIELSDLDSTATGQIDVTVNPINDPPEFVNIPKDSICIGKPYLYIFWVNDPDKDELTYSVPDIPDWLTFAALDSSITGTPGIEDIGIDTLVVRAYDGTINTDITVYIEVKSCNNAPYFTSDPPTEIDEDVDYAYNIVVYDDDEADVDNLTVSAPTCPGWLTLDAENKILYGKPTNDQVGTNPYSAYFVQLRVTDGKDYTNQDFTVTVYNINDAPEIQTQTKVVGAYIGIAKTILITDIDVIDVDNIISDLTLTVLPPASGTDYSLSGNNTIIISEGVTAQSIEVNFRVSDPEMAQDEGILNVTVLDNTGIEDMVQSNGLVEKIYPVPAVNSVKFVINSNYEYEIELIDITGKVVFEQQFTRNDKLVEINTSDFPAGLYIFKINDGTEYQVGRLTISNK
jgi:hypothetical protein